MFENMIPIMGLLALAFLIWDCFEVGRNDAANLINAVFGARVLQRRTAIIIAALAVILGASFASPVMETARKGIFDPALLTIETAMIVYLSVYIVDTVLLYTYSSFGMPVSTTASLVFELIGASLAVAFLTNPVIPSADIVHGAKVITVIKAILISIALSGIAGFMIQRVFRGAIGNKIDNYIKLMIHGPWIAGFMVSGLTWFMVMKGLKAIPIIKTFKSNMEESIGSGFFMLILWAGFTLLIHLILAITGKKGARLLFPTMAVIGMICMAFAFGQNDLANCASPGLAALNLWQNADQTTEIASKINLSTWMLAGCGILMALGMSTKTAQRVTRAAVNTGSQYDHVALYAPKWCRKIAQRCIRTPKQGQITVDLAPKPSVDNHGKRIHFDPMRASVIMSVSASVIAFASSKGYPVSTTYVTFAAVVASGYADGAMSRGDGDRKIGRAIWVVFSWFSGALLAMVASAIIAALLMKLHLIGIILAVASNFIIRAFIKKRSAKHEKAHHEIISEKLRSQDQNMAETS